MPKGQCEIKPAGGSLRGGSGATDSVRKILKKKKKGLQRGVSTHSGLSNTKYWNGGRENNPKNETPLGTLTGNRGTGRGEKGGRLKSRGQTKRLQRLLAKKKKRKKKDRFNTKTPGKAET